MSGKIQDFEKDVAYTGEIFSAYDRAKADDYVPAEADPEKGEEYEDNRSSNASTSPNKVEPGDVDLEAARTVSSDRVPYSVFSKKQKRFIIFMAACAGFISPFSASIYFPALNVLAKDLNVTNGLINLTLTTYMIFQGLAPTFMGDLADLAGRRPAYVIGFIIYIGACIGIALQDSFVALLILRCVQSAGSSGTVALGSGVVTDISTPAERGSAMGWMTSGMLIGPAVGPVLGGILAQFLGWRSIFWFLAILVGVFLIPFVLVFPETGRLIVGNGSLTPQGWNMSVLNWLQARRQRKIENEASPDDRPSTLQRTQSAKSIQAAREEVERHKKNKKLKFPNPLHTMKVVLEKDIALLLLFNSIVYTAFYDITASTPYLFAQTYGYNDLQIGLCFIPYGVGCFLAPIINGRLLDWNFRRVAKNAGIEVDKKKATKLENFPLEKARVHIAWPLILIGDVCILIYGWVMQINAPLAAPLILQFIMGITLTGSFNVMSVMLVDNYPLSPATATAANNLVRCWMGAGGTAVIIYMIDSMGRGWCFTLIAGIVLLFMPTLWMLVKWGPQWRAQRHQRMEERKSIK